MNFIEATTGMLNGQSMVRQKWSGAGYLVMIIKGQGYIWTMPFVNDKPTIPASLYTPSVEDILATDWIIKN